MFYFYNILWGSKTFSEFDLFLINSL
jgi:hypothetical protein